MMALDTKRGREDENTDSKTNRIDSELFSDCVCIMCLSTEAKTCLLVRDPEQRGWWLPYITIDPSHSWNEAAVRVASTVLEKRPGEEGDVEPQLYRVMRCFFPMSIRPATVVTFLVTIDESPSSKVEQNKRWFSTDELLDMVVNGTLLGSEPLELFMKLHDGKSLVDVYEVFSDRKIASYEDNEEPVRKKRLLAAGQLLQSANYGTRERELFYVAFMLKVFPRTEMCRAVFEQEMDSIGWPKETTSSLFHSFDQKQCNFVSFRDFLMGSAVTETCTQHGGPPAEIRCRYIFRYYNAGCDGILKFEEFRNMVSDIRKLKDEPLADAALDAAAKTDFQFFSRTPEETLLLSNFLFTVGKLRFRGTSRLLRFDNFFQSFLASAKVPASLSSENRVESEQNVRRSVT